MFLHIALSTGTFVPSALSRPVTRPLEVHECHLSAAVPIRRLHLPSQKPFICQTCALPQTYHSSQAATEANSHCLTFQWLSRLAGNVRRTLTGCCSHSFKEDTLSVNTACQATLEHSLVQENRGMESAGGGNFITTGEQGRLVEQAFGNIFDKLQYINTTPASWGTLADFTLPFKIKQKAGQAGSSFQIYRRFLRH